MKRSPQSSVPKPKPIPETNLTINEPNNNSILNHVDVSNNQISLILTLPKITIPNYYVVKGASRGFTPKVKQNTFR